MKIIKKEKQEPKASLTREEVSRRQVIADAILRKMSFGTFRVRQNLIAWLREAQRVTKFDLATLKKFGLVTDAQINGKLGAEAKALRKANMPIFEGLVQFPAAELDRYYRLMSAASIQRRYGNKMQDREIGVRIILPKEEMRKVEVGSKKQIAGWVRSKDNKQVRAAFEPTRQVLREKARKPRRPVTETMKDYLKGLNKFGAYIDSGLRVRKQWMDELEARTGLKQSMHNSSDHA